MQTCAAKLNTIANIKASTINQRLNKPIILHQTRTSSQKVLKIWVTFHAICPFWTPKESQNLASNPKAAQPALGKSHSPTLVNTKQESLFN
jgi:hypothetical protein